MVPRQLFAALLLVAALMAAPAAAHAQRPASWDDSPDASYDDGGGSGYGDAGVADGYTDPNADAGGTQPGDMPATVTPVVPTTPTTPITPTAPGSTLPTVPITRTIAGTVARMRTDGRAAIPRGAPKTVQRIIAAANKIIGKPYVWGGGHAKLIDRGYDCSGAVSYALIRAGLLGSPLVSGSLAHWSSGGNGRWVSVYANKGHVYMEIAGLRFDTSPVGDPTRRMGVRWRPAIGRRSGFAARHPAGY